MSSNMHRVTIDLTYADGDLSEVHTANYAASLRNSFALATNSVTATVSVENDVNAERIVKFTPAEVTELADFLRTFEASPKAMDLLHRISMRSIYAVADAEDNEPIEDASNRFSSVRAYPGMRGLSIISTEEPTA